jgi:hypothetical protein
VRKKAWITGFMKTGTLNISIEIGDHLLRLAAREKRLYESCFVLLVDRKLEEVICFEDENFKGQM